MPIKKRKFLLIRPASPSPQMPPMTPKPISKQKEEFSLKGKSISEQKEETTLKGESLSSPASPSALEKEHVPLNAESPSTAGSPCCYNISSDYHFSHIFGSGFCMAVISSLILYFIDFSTYHNMRRWNSNHGKDNPI